MNQPPPTTATPEPTRVRLGVLGFACSLSLITYLDRICIAQVQDHIVRDLGIDRDWGMGLVFGAFALGYMCFEVPGGWMGDVWGARRIITRIVLWWSVFTALTGYIDWLLALGLGVDLVTPTVALWALIIVRFLFGCGEAGAYPNVARMVSNWFPPRERGLAQGGVWMSARLGGAIAPFAILYLTSLVGWRNAFVVLGLIGVAWCLLFYVRFRDRPHEVPRCNNAERALIRGAPALAPEAEPLRPGEPSEQLATGPPPVPTMRPHVAAGPPGTAPDTGIAADEPPLTSADRPLPSLTVRDSHHGHPVPPWGLLLTNMTMWCLCLAAFGVSFGWYFYPTFQPRYLEDVFGINFKDSGWLTALPFLCGAWGALLGGGLSERLISWTGSRRWGRSLVGVVGFTGAGICVCLTGFSWEPWQAVTLLCLAFFINDLAIPPIWSVCSDIGGRFTGTISGMMNMVGALGAVLGPVTMGLLLSAFSDLPSDMKWRIIFVILSSAWFVAAIAWLGIDASKPIIHEERIEGSQ